MKKVKCVSDINDYITVGGIYDVIDSKYHPNGYYHKIFIYDDIGELCEYHIKCLNFRTGKEVILFIDATNEYRNLTIDDILS